MPTFSPFAGLRYDPDKAGSPPADLVCPPYDVISPEEAAGLSRRSPFNAIRVELPPEEEGPERYEAAAVRLREWEESGVLIRDEPSYYAYRMGFHDEAGVPRQTTGVIGALGLEEPGTGDILPHEHTTPKAKSDRLQLLSATRVNTSPIWGLSPTSGLSALCELPDPPIMRSTDEEGVHHRLWRIQRPGVIEAISAAVSSEPVIVADGHHRFETAYQYAQNDGAGVPGSEAVMALIVELTGDQLRVRAIHRLLSGLPASSEIPSLFEPCFELSETWAIDATITERMDEAGSLCLHTAVGTWLMRPRDSVRSAASADLDSSRLDIALAGIEAVDVRYQHGWEQVASAVSKGEAQAGVLLRPATVAQIAATGRDRARMPPKTTFFWPKPRTGFVFRPLA